MRETAKHWRVQAFAMAGLLAFGGVGAQETQPVKQAPPAAGCDAFTWDVSRELSLMATPAETVEAGAGPDTLATLALDRHYTLRLPPQRDVALAVQPGKPSNDDNARAGIVRFRVPSDGAYRVAISTRHWIDVVDAGKVVPSRDFQGRRGCEAIHKVVEFVLRGDRAVLLQLIGSADSDVGVVIAAAPAATK